MKEILLAKEEGLRIAISILNGKKANKDYGGTALKETELILKNILETLQVEKEMTAKSPTKPKKPNKKRAPMRKGEQQYVNQILASMDKSNRQGLTILDLENEHGKSRQT